MLNEILISRLEPHVDAIGFAPVGRFNGAPEKHHPADVCRDARTVVVFGIAVTRGVLSSPGYNLHALHRSYHTIYRRLDELGMAVCNLIENKGGCLAVPVPSYAPMVFHGMEPWGIISLKHAAVKAGLGAFGRSGQVYHPEFGARLRLGAVVTSAEMPGDPVTEADPCPNHCTACLKSCPGGAFDQSEKFHKLNCLSYAIKHAIYPLALKDEKGLRHIERVINTAGHDYWIACNECLKACPLNRRADEVSD